MPKKKIMVTQVRSAIRRPKVQQKTLHGLGLKRLHQKRILEDTPSVRGMICKILHLLEVKEV